MPDKNPPIDIIIELKLPDNAGFISIEGLKRFTLGRTGQDSKSEESKYSSEESLDIDLSPFHAYEKGISRNHALIEVESGQVFVTDMDSSNGTRINGRLIPSNRPQTICNNDILTLGRLKMTILISTSKTWSRP